MPRLAVDRPDSILVTVCDHNSLLGGSSALRHSYFTHEMQAHEKSLPFEYAEVGVSLWLRWRDERAG